MKPQSIVLATVLLAGCAPSFAQAPPAVPQDYQAMMQAVERAQAEANQPGDQQLSCTQLQEQLVAIAQDPAFLAHMKRAGVAAEKDMAQMKAAESEIAAKSAATFIASTVPGAAMGHMAAGAAENQAKAAQAAERMQSKIADAQQMMAFMPKMMRGQRLVELAAARKCEWAEGVVSQ